MEQTGSAQINEDLIFPYAFLILISFYLKEEQIIRKKCLLIVWIIYANTIYL